MSRFYVPKEAVGGDRIHITGKEAHHILDVMRLKVSDPVIVFDGTGKEYEGVIGTVGRDSLDVEILRTRAARPEENAAISLIQAIPKKEKMDLIVEKATELGIRSIIPVVTERTIVRWDDRKRAGSVERWRKIALAAAKQCGRSDFPDIGAVARFLDCLESGEESVLKVIAALSDKAMPLKKTLKGYAGKKITVAIGPEGDFTEKEMKEAERAGFKVISLGPRVLRSDTAGLFAISAINYEFSDR